MKYIRMKILHIYFILVDYSMTTIKELIKCIVEAHILYCNKKNLINIKSQKNFEPRVRKIFTHNKTQFKGLC